MAQQLASQLTIAGNLAADPELRFTQSGVAVCNFRVIVNTRAFDRTSNQWLDADVTSYQATAWRGQAENIAKTLSKGDRVIVNGALRTETWDKDGETQYALRLEVHEVGASLLKAEAAITRNRAEDTSSAEQTDPWADGGSGV
jgi:single-strand DNA-binding protein